MFDMKNDDMDELFRKAAENYEVDTSRASGWDAVNKALHSADGFNVEEDDKEKKKRRFFFFWWFLLLPALLLGYYSWKKIGSTKQEDITLKTTPVKTTKEAKEISAALKLPENTIANKSAANAKEHSLNETSDNNKNNNGVEKNKKDNSLSEKDAISNKNNTVQNNPALNAIVHKESNRNHRSSDNTVLNKKPFYTNNQRNNTVVDSENKANDKAITQHKKNNSNNIRNKHTNNTGLSIPDGEAKKTITGSFQYVFTDHDGKMLPVISFEENISGLPPGIEGLSVDRGDSSLKQNKDKVDKKQPHYFYAVAVVAPDLSSVKFQRIAGAGSSAGLLLGYRINKHWHIETGAMWEKKIYYTEGKYFDKSKLTPYLMGVEIMNANGNCHMITIPLNVRYNVSAGEKSNWFVATGMSSYLMNKEYYDFTYRHPGGQPITKGYEYKTAEKNWMTVINLNLGYERTFLKTFNFRVAPYFRLPVSGVGTGNLSLSSGGVYIGIGKKF